MDEIALNQLKFPIGKFIVSDEFNAFKLEAYILDIELFPEKLVKLLQSVSIEQLNWKYRPDGWTVKQVVHHCADSHINSFIRFKLALTEDLPIIKPYREERWANTIDGLDNNLNDSFMLLNGLHHKWVNLLRSLTEMELNRRFIHPDLNKSFALKDVIGFYAWHCNHHFQHINLALMSNGIYNQ